MLFGGLGVPELIVILLLVVILFGARKIPELARGLGKGITEFKRGLKDTSESRDSGGRIEDDAANSNQNEESAK
jgi:sec-independent protein translocase protein TatA